MLSHATEPHDLFGRLRRILSSLHLDCECRATLDGALDRFSDLELRRQLRTALAEARRQREWIAAQVGFLAELDEITEHETDVSVYEEMAALFDEIGASAIGAAEAIRLGRSGSPADAMRG
jgi:hypothetical protein